ncbi:hypothetical protein V7S43_016935 [Phytophthora oleae]|uniref:GPI inositol-deacylase n=1 Tax=Phytophthora oleae TaxID=2107226 RepID=A0ABD3EUW6_9STRA
MQRATGNALPVMVFVLALLLALGGHGVSSLDRADDTQLVSLQNTTEWPSLRFNFTLKRSSMTVHGQSFFSMLASPIVPVDGGKVLYNVFSSFIEDKNIHNYTLVDGVGYYSSVNMDNSTDFAEVQCLEPGFDHLPPINSIVSALNQATPISTAPNGVECLSGNLFKISVNDIDFALCAAGSSGFTMHGNDMEITVDYIHKRLDILAPISPKCEVLVNSSITTATGRAFLNGSPVLTDSRRLKADFDFSWGDNSPTCSCKSTPRPCIFIHGMGVTYELPGNQDSFKYWGNLTGHAPCCTTRKYMVLDTVNNTWTNTTQHQKVCDRALAVSKTSTDTSITDTIVVTHSMGNLLLAGAIAAGMCTLDSSSTWVGIAAPMKGSKASDFIQESCAGNTNFILEYMVEDSGRCPPTTALKSMPYMGESFSSKKLDAAFSTAQEVFRTNVSALMCSSSFSGLRSPDQTTLWTLGMVGRHHSWKNDGMVEFQSCAVGIPASKFGTSWKSRFYRTKLNHYDMQFRYGDGLFSKAKMPVKWLSTGTLEFPTSKLSSSAMMPPAQEIIDKATSITDFTCGPLQASDREEYYALIARFVAAGGRITQKQLREAQRRHVKKPEDLLFLLGKDIISLRGEIETLKHERQHGSTAVQYFGLVCHGYKNLLGYMRDVAVADVIFNDEYGPEAVVRFWCFSRWFGDVNVEVEEFQTRGCHSLVAVTTTRVTITRKTLRSVFPHSRTIDNSDRNCTLANRLLNRRLVLRGSTRFEWDNSTRRVTRITSQSDMMTPMLELLGNLEDVSIVFEKALISPEVH